MEDCKYIQDLLPFYIDDGILTEAERRAVNLHIAHCDSCSKELEALQHNAWMLHQMGRSIFQAPSGLSARIMEQLRSETAASNFSEAPAVKKIEKTKILSLRPRHFWSGIAAAMILAVTVVGVPTLIPDDSSLTRVAQEQPVSQVEGTTLSTNSAEKTETSSSIEQTAPMENVSSNISEEEPTDSVPVQAPESEPPTVVEKETSATSEDATPFSSALESETNTSTGYTPAETQSTQSPSNLILLNQDDEVRSTLLKMSFTDVEAAVLQLETLVADFEGKITDTTVSSDSNCEIFTVKVPRSQADSFIVSITSSGFVLSQEQDFKTSLYSQLMEEYLQLQTQLNASTSEEVSMQLQTQLAEVEQRMNAAQEDVQYETVVIWIQLAA